MKPDSSFDLNGDGTISAHEYAIAKMFDKDKDNKLNQTEKQQWINALKKGFESKIIWSESSNDPNITHRVVQKDGKVYYTDRVHGEDNSVKTNLRTKTFLDESRQRQLNIDSKKLFSKWHNKYMNSMSQK